jgi:hypothetical protein
MSLAIPNSPTNRGLASAVNNRIHSDAVMLLAKATLWRFGGFGLFCLLLGCGVGAALERCRCQNPVWSDWIPARRSG